jgi:rhodanese-related sulfurtransferase
MQTVDRQEETPARSGRVFVVAAVASVLLLGAYFALGMPGMDHSNEPMEDMDHSGTAGLQELSPLEFETQLVDDDAFVVNVHVPADDSLVGTDQTIAFDEIVGSDRLPNADTSSTILLYCESGTMSETAGRALVKAGYSDVGHLVGGLKAWRRAGLELVPSSVPAR